MPCHFFSVFPTRLWRSRQQGSGLPEFLVVAGPLIMTALGGIEITHWMFVRQAVGLALAEAARAGSTLHARPQDIASAFEQGLEPFFPPTASATATGRVATAVARTAYRLQGQPWHIQIISPGLAAFADFPASTAKAPHPSGLAAINNAYQPEQHQAALQSGWPQGKGPVSQQTIFDANTLTLQLTWRHLPLLPGMATLMGDALVIQQNMVIEMQSDPLLWPDDPTGRVTRGHIKPHRPVQPDHQDSMGSGLSSGHAPVTSDAGPAGTEHAVSSGQAPLAHQGPGPATEPGNSVPVEYQGTDGADAGAAGDVDDTMCTKISPSLTIPSSERALSSIASVPDFRS